jgi:hypothetical protein
MDTGFYSPHKTGGKIIMAAKRSLNDMTDKEWLNEYAKDMGYTFTIKVGNKTPYRLKKDGREHMFATLREARNLVLRDLHRYIGDHTTIVSPSGKVIEMSPADKRKLEAKKKK